MASDSSGIAQYGSDDMPTPVDDFRHPLTARSFQKPPHKSRCGTYQRIRQAIKLAAGVKA